jgi:hypothetical protein
VPGLMVVPFAKNAVILFSIFFIKNVFIEYMDGAHAQ